MSLICYICREVICKMKKISKFEEAYDFCPRCKKEMLQQFENQFRPKRKLRLEGS